MTSLSAHLDRVGELVASVASSWPIAPDGRAQTALGLAGEALRQAREEGPPAVTMLAIAHAHIFHAALRLSMLAPASAALRPALSALLTACSELLAAESLPLNPRVVVEPEFELEKYPLERCAKLAAALDCRPSDARDILASVDLDEARFRRLSAEHQRGIAAEQKRGRTALLTKHDDCYVAQLEQERGEVTPEDYAELKSAASFGTLDEVLPRLRVPARALMPIERVWLRRMLANSELRKRVRAALNQKRDDS
ncbi:MAG: hypothetical protein U0271_36055 [Polyangiaceae bacterium]